MTQNGEYELLVGTYTGGRSEGIYRFAFDSRDGSFRKDGPVRVENPSYLGISPEESFVYSVSENPDRTGFANALQQDKETGALSLINRQPTHGKGPCYITVDPLSKFVLTADYADGSLSVFPLAKDGSLGPLSRFFVFSGNGPVSGRQESSHPHSIRFSPEGRYLFICDLGTDTIYRFGLDYGSPGLVVASSRVDYKVDAGDGPRQLLFSPNGRYLYLINELSGTVTVFLYRDGEISFRQKVQIGEDPGGDAGAMAITPDGKFLYASMREGNDGVAVFRIDPDSGELSGQQYMHTSLHPRSLAVSPDGKFLLCAAMKGNIIEAYPIDGSTGKPGEIAAQARVDQPVCMVFAGTPEK